MRKITIVLGVLVVCGLLAGTSSPTLAEDGNWQVRTRLIFIEPNDDADGTLATLGAEVEDDFTVEVDVTYFVTPRFGIEGILATAAQEVMVDAAGGGSDSFGSINHAPATFTAQYHFRPKGNIRPYAGAGINYTIFYSESGGFDDLDLDSGSFGVAGQVGIDFMIGEKNMFNLDLKYVDIDIEVKDSGTSLGTADIDPFIVGVGFGHRF